jgi:hypothetical protein
MNARDPYLHQNLTPDDIALLEEGMRNTVVDGVPIDPRDIFSNPERFNSYKFDVPLNVTVGEYLIAITNEGKTSFPLGCSEQIFTKGTSFFREGVWCDNPAKSAPAQESEPSGSTRLFSTYEGSLKKWHFGTSMFLVPCKEEVSEFR